MLNLLKRAYLLFMIRSLERELHDQRESLRTVQDTNTYKHIALAESETRAELAKFRSAYSSLLPVGEINVWPMA